MNRAQAYIVPVLAFLTRRWRLLSIAAALALTALLSILVITHRNNLFVLLNDPGTPFQIWQPPPAPDYAEADAWALAPDLSDDDVAAVFFIHPTTYSGGGDWNAPIDKPLSRNTVDRIMLPNHAGPFIAAGPVFAPRYRQASLYTLLTNRDDARRARTFAYRDVARAFDAFLERIGDERAFVLAGTGQGGLHAIGLLRDRVARDPAVQNRMIAAYIIEYPVPADLYDNALSPLTPCRAAGDFRCVISWASARASDTRRIRHLTEHLMVWGPGDMRPVSGRRLTCMNPLLWNLSEDFAPARLNRGAVAAEGLESGVMPSPAPGQTSAQCQDGVLLIEDAASRRFRPPLALVQRYRVQPYNLFYEDIRANLAVRTQAALARMADDARYAAPIEQEVIFGAAPIHRVPD